jgi:hypothetical protein
VGVNRAAGGWWIESTAPQYSQTSGTPGGAGALACLVVRPPKVRLRQVAQAHLPDQSRSLRHEPTRFPCMFPSFAHHDPNRRQNEPKRRRISVTALVARPTGGSPPPPTLAACRAADRQKRRMIEARWVATARRVAAERRARRLNNNSGQYLLLLPRRRRRQALDRILGPGYIHEKWLVIGSRWVAKPLALAAPAKTTATQWPRVCGGARWRGADTPPLPPPRNAHAWMRACWGQRGG